MCLSQSTDVKEAKEPIDRDANAAQKAYGRARRKRAAAFDESDTDVVGAVIANQNKPQVNTQLKQLMGG